MPSGVSEATHSSDDDAAAVSETTQQHRRQAAAVSLREQPHQRMKLGFFVLCATLARVEPARRRIVSSRDFAFQN